MSKTIIGTILEIEKLAGTTLNLATIKIDDEETICITYNPEISNIEINNKYNLILHNDGTTELIYPIEE